jgi:hypothetical protein
MMRCGNKLQWVYNKNSCDILHHHDLIPLFQLLACYPFTEEVVNIFLFYKIWLYYFHRCGFLCLITARRRTIDHYIKLIMMLGSWSPNFHCFMANNFYIFRENGRIKKQYVDTKSHIHLIDSWGCKSNIV